MKSSTFHKTIFGLLLLLVFYVCVPAQDQNGDKAKRNGVVFKIPDDVFPIDFKKSGFTGILMLRKDGPSGLFVAYPNEGESLEHLRDRLGTFIAPMFVHDKGEAGKLEPKIATVPVHSGDVEGTGSYYLYSGNKEQVQVLFYQRVANGSPLLYGYFSKKNIDTKEKDELKAWADENGQGVSFFEKFWKTIKE